jgi:hypothetical protein
MLETAFEHKILISAQYYNMIFYRHNYLQDFCENN